MKEELQTLVLQLSEERNVYVVEEGVFETIACCTEEQIKDMLTYASQRDVSRSTVFGVLLHDLCGIRENWDCFLPKTAGSADWSVLPKTKAHRLGAFNSISELVKHQYIEEGVLDKNNVFTESNEKMVLSYYITKHKGFISVELEIEPNF